MPNPILPAWEYIPDGEPRVFGDRVYLYGSHDRAAQSDFCDYKLKSGLHHLMTLTIGSATDIASIPVMTVTISPIPRE